MKQLYTSCFFLQFLSKFSIHFFPKPGGGGGLFGENQAGWFNKAGFVPGPGPRGASKAFFYMEFWRSFEFVGGLNRGFLKETKIINFSTCFIFLNKSD